LKSRSVAQDLQILERHTTHVNHMSYHRYGCRKSSLQDSEMYLSRKCASNLDATLRVPCYHSTFSTCEDGLHKESQMGQLSELYDLNCTLTELDNSNSEKICRIIAFGAYVVAGVVAAGSVGPTDIDDDLVVTNGSPR
jgi:hypothetical protein